MNSLVIAVDFDGTLVTDDFPKICNPVPFAIDVLNKLIAKKHRIILYTMRENSYLKDALQYLMKNRIKLYGINRNPSIIWTGSTKVYADLYVDNSAVGCPLMIDKNLSDKTFADWKKIDEILTNMGVYNGVFAKEKLIANPVK